MSDIERLLGTVRTMVAVVTPSGTIAEIHGPVRELLGLTPAQCRGLRMSTLMTPQDLPSFEGACAAALDPAGAGQTVPARLTALGPGGRRLPVDALVAGDPDQPGGWVVQLIGRGALSSGSEPLELLLAGAPWASVLGVAARALSAAGEGGGGRRFTVLLGERLDDVPRARTAAPQREAMVADPELPSEILDALAATGDTGVAPLWADARPHTLHEVDLDDLPLLVAATARAHDLVGAGLATVEVDGHVELCLLTFFDEVAWATTRHAWAGRAQQLSQVLSIAFGFRHARERLERAATHDGLTALPNRQRFFDAIAAYEGDLAVLVVDLDRLGEINERFGHFSGDRVLQELARRLKATCRTGDLVARLGGDEFAVALPTLNVTNAVTVARRIVSAAGVALPSGFGPLSMSVSVGVARASANARDDGELLAIADRAARHAARQGGDRVAIAAGVDHAVTPTDDPVASLLD